MPFMAGCVVFLLACGRGWLVHGAEGPNILSKQNEVAKQLGCPDSKSMVLTWCDCCLSNLHQVKEQH